MSTKFIFAIIFSVSLFSFAGEIKKVDYLQYTNKVAELNSACKTKGLTGFSGFCLSQEYGKTSIENLTQTSITIGSQIASLQYFRSQCNHFNNPQINETVGKAKKVLDAGKFFDEMKNQSEALENYFGRFQYCGTTQENNLSISKDLNWLDYMISRYSTRSRNLNLAPDSTEASDKLVEFSATVGRDRLALSCNGREIVDVACSIKLGTTDVQPVRFKSETTRYAHLLREGLEKALASDQAARLLGATDIRLLQEIDLTQCHPATEANGMSGDLLQLCIPADASKVVLFMRGLCDRCEFQPYVLQKQTK